MKKIFTLIAICLSCVLTYAQDVRIDTLVTRNGETILATIQKNGIETIEYIEKGETMVVEKIKKDFSSIHFANGRVENIVQEKKIYNFEDVILTEDKSQVEGLTRVCDVKESSSWGGVMGYKKGIKKCEKELKKQAYENGGWIVLITEKNTGPTRMRQSYEGIAYK